MDFHLPAGNRHHGFTLVELAIVLFVIGLLVAGLIGPVEVQMEARDRRKTLETMEQAREALYGFALTHRRLPCPDTDGDGRSNPPFDATDAGTMAATAVCEVITDQNGFLPWFELGLAGGDAWGNRITYRVSNPQFTMPAQDLACNGDEAGTDEFDLCATGDIRLRTRGDDPSTTGTTESKYLFDAVTTGAVVAVLVSHGRNGYGATSVDGIKRGEVPADNADEDENADGDELFISRTYSRGESDCADDGEGSPLCEFDDIVVTLSRPVLNSRMVSAGQLP
jgi:prepilin-type N-terminal cleavage/methylation domain-containing protein